MNEAKIIKVGDTPRIEGSRISVFDVLDYYKNDWRASDIARLFNLTARQIEVAIEYVEEHKDEVWEAYNRILERHAQGNPPELQAKLDAVRGSARARLQELRRSRSQESANEGSSGGQR
jgi:uncharacterized protein (DUF433 family)